MGIETHSNIKHMCDGGGCSSKFKNFIFVLEISFSTKIECTRSCIDYQNIF